jgi:adenylate cyclase
LAFDAVTDGQVGVGAAGSGLGELLAEGVEGAAAAGGGGGVEPDVQGVPGDVQVAGEGERLPDKRARIAIIEDDIAIVQMYGTKFENEDYEIATAMDGIDVLALISSFEPDVILLDPMMPNMNCLDMPSKLRSQQAGRDAKMIVLTNMGDTETATKVYKMAADDSHRESRNDP